LLQASALGVGALAAPGALAACSSGGSGGDNTSPGASNAPKVELGEPSSGVYYRDGYVGPKAYDRKPFSDGSKTFKVVVPQDATVVGDWNNNKTTTWMEQRTGLKIQFESVLTTGADGSQDLTKINAMLSSGDLPDAFMGIPFTQAQLSLYGQQGLFVALDDYINTYAPMTQQEMKDYADIRSLTAGTDNKLYSMPGVNDCYQCHYGAGRAWIKQAYLDKIGMKMPTTTDELHQVLLEFKNKNPSGKSDFVPLTAGQSDPIDNYFMQPFVYNPGSTALWVVLDNDKLSFVANTDGWRDGLKYLRQLFDDGIITEQTFTMTGTELQTLGNKSLIGVARNFWWGSFYNPLPLDADAPWRDYVALPPVKGPGGQQNALWDYYNYKTNGLQITSSWSDRALLVQWSDYQMDLDAIEWAYNGVKDDNWSYSKQGAKGIDGQQAVWNQKVWPAPQGTSWNQYSTMYRSLDFRNGQQVDTGAPPPAAGLYNVGKYYDPYKPSQDKQLPPLIISDDDAAQVADVAASVTQAVQQGLVQFATGKKNVNNDSDWQAYVDAFTSMNLPTYLSVYQKAYDTRPK